MSRQSDGDFSAYDTSSPLFDAPEPERRREAEREPFRHLAEALPQIVWTTGPEGLIDYLNRRWYEYTGLSHEESTGMGWQRIRSATPSGSSLVTVPVRQAPSARRTGATRGRVSSAVRRGSWSMRRC